MSDYTTTDASGTKWTLTTSSASWVDYQYAYPVYTWDEQPQGSGLYDKIPLPQLQWINKAEWDLQKEFYKQRELLFTMEMQKHYDAYIHSMSGIQSLLQARKPIVLSSNIKLL